MGTLPLQLLNLKFPQFALKLDTFSVVVGVLDDQRKLLSKSMQL